MLKPKCFFKQDAAVNAQGFLLPCCWCDIPDVLYHKDFKKLIKDKFHLSKVKDINEVIYSDEWQEFKKDLQESNMDKWPPVCKSQCEVKDGDNKQNKIQKYYIGEKEVRRTIK